MEKPKNQEQNQQERLKSAEKAYQNKRKNTHSLTGFMAVLNRAEKRGLNKLEITKGIFKKK
ncbi:hypothetical protein ACFL13_01365 [Patescibacteria group bacterium]